MSNEYKKPDRNFAFDDMAESLRENKEHYIESFLSIKDADGELIDKEDEALSYEGVFAADADPLSYEKQRLAVRLAVEKTLCRVRNKQLQDLCIMRDRNSAYAKDNRRLEQYAREDFRFYNKNKFTLSAQERTAFGEKLFRAVSENQGTGTETFVGTYKGFDISLPAVREGEQLRIGISRTGGGSYSCETEKDVTALSCMDCIDCLLDSLGRKAENFEFLARTFERRTKKAEKALEEGNPHVGRIAELRNRISEIEAQIKADIENK
ncbi:MAG: hypothetical protein IJB74_09230 [Clostridia bacterium]|nr:hypothetical protein [Clostridia bacterium]